MRGIANYYALASGAKKGLNRLMYMAKSSFLATLATKHKSTISKINAQHRSGADIVVNTKSKEGKRQRYILFTLRSWKPPKPKEDADVLPNQGIQLRLGRSSLQQRLLADNCEYCGKQGGFFGAHHVKKLKDVKGKALWEQAMIAKKRKTLVLCIECHDLLHAGTLSQKQKGF